MSEPSDSPHPRRLRSPRYWTAAEDELLREHYPRGGPAACLPHLPGRLWNAIGMRARTLGLRAPPRGRGPAIESR